MPEGPSIVILAEEAKEFSGKKILNVSGNSKENIRRLKHQKIIGFKSWGKHFLICFDSFTLRIHFLLFGSYRINEEKESDPRLSLKFKNGFLNFYSCSVKFIEDKAENIYDWSVDVMSDEWDAEKAYRNCRLHPETLLCDVLLDQQIFSGVGNIIKNEVLYRVKLHPENKIADVPAAKLKLMIKEARNYSFDFLEWKIQYVLKKHWLAHTKKICMRCNLPIIKKYCGKTNRRTFFCINCQVKY
jgi:endonuclease-8